jgi:hypothetical protein
MKLSEVLESLRLKFTSGNAVPVERAFILKEEYEVILNVINTYQTALEDIRNFADYYPGCGEYSCGQKAIEALEKIK